MGHRNIYTCDKCGHEQGGMKKTKEGERNLLHLGFYYAKPGVEYTSMPTHPSNVGGSLLVLWCHECFIEADVAKKCRTHVEWPAPAVPPTPGEFFEQLVRDIVGEHLP